MNRPIKSLEGMRGLAALLVVLYHAKVSRPPIFDNGYLAVDLFFVLSGFVICTTYGSRLQRIADLPAFVARRLGRLWPVHLVGLMLYIANWNLVAWILSAHPVGLPPLSEFVANLTMVHGFNLFDRLVGDCASWSSADEFYIYLMFAAICILARGRHRVAILAVCALFAWAICVWASTIQEDCLHRGRCLELTFRFGWARCVAGFFLGALLAEYRDTHIVRALSRGHAQLVVAAAALVYMNLAGSLRGLAFAAPLVFVFLIAAVASDEGPAARFFHRPIWQSLGKVSYSLYLVHADLLGPLFAPLAGLHPRPLAAVLATTAVYFVGSVLLAHVVYRFVEAPCRDRVNRMSRRWERPSTKNVQASYDVPSEAPVAGIR
ncbi:MAG: acyltransferase family protein [Trinickia sp.]|uniref:acyltransferase family protein n=1 Tax=Trinickia sp. TaxID=2571163 RepID=UPI003F7DF82B